MKHSHDYDIILTNLTPLSNPPGEHPEVLFLHIFKTNCPNDHINCNCNWIHNQVIIPSLHCPWYRSKIILAILYVYTELCVVSFHRRGQRKIFHKKWQKKYTIHTRTFPWVFCWTFSSVKSEFEAILACLCVEIAVFFLLSYLWFKIEWKFTEKSLLLWLIFWKSADLNNETVLFWFKDIPRFSCFTTSCNTILGNTGFPQSKRHNILFPVLFIDSITWSWHISYILRSDITYN